MAVFGTLKQKDGTPVYLNTALKIDGDTYSLNDVITELLKVPDQAASETRSANIASGDTYTVPEYVVGCNNLAVYLDGVRAFAGIDFTEVGDADTLSTSITFNNSIAKDVQIVARVDNHVHKLRVK